MVSSPSPVRVRLRSWWLFVLEPWRSVAVAIALVGALSLPAALLSAGPMFEHSAADAISARVLDDVAPGPAGLHIGMKGTFAPELLTPLSDSVASRLEAIDPLAPPVRTMVSAPVALDATLGSGRPARVDLFARDGAIEALDVVAGDRSVAGMWISEYLAAGTALEPGDLVTVTGATEPVPVAGVYRDLWAAPLPDYWDAVPEEFIPSFSGVFNSTLFELAIVHVDLIGQLASGGRTIWQASLDDYPTSHDALVELAASYRSLERSFRGETELALQYRAAAEDPTVLPGVFTATDAALDRATILIGELEQPIRTTTVAGAAAGVLLATLGGVFMIRRRRNEYRLRAADGDQWWRFFGRGVAQYLLPAAAGIVVGIGIAFAAIVTLGPSGSADVGAIPFGEVVLVSAFACGAAAVVTAALAVRLADGLGLPDVGRGWLFLIVGAALAMWFQVGRDEAGDVNPLVVAFPFVGILAGVVLAVVALRWLLRSVRRTGGRLPTPLFLAWRALTASEGGALLLTAALGMAAGLAVLSASFVTSADTAAAAKAATTVGSSTQVELRSNADEVTLPPRSTVIRYEDTKVGDTRVRVIAVDPDTFVDAVSWPDAFGGSPQDVLDALDAPLDDAIPAVVVGGEQNDALRARSEFGASRSLPYEVVATVGSFPLASATTPTLAIRADRLEAFLLERIEEGLEELDPIDVQTAETLDQDVDIEPALTGYRSTVVSKAPLDEVVATIEGAGGRVGDVTTLEDQVGNPEAQATRWAFDFLRILGAIAGVTAIVSLALYLAERKREREVAAAMTAQMGVAGRTNVIAAVIEMAGLALVALAAGSVCAVITARRVFPSFDPDPRIPPSTTLSVSGGQVLGFALIVLGAVALTAALVQRSANAASKSRVLRG